MSIRDVFQQTKPDIYRLVRPYIIAEVGVNHEGNMNLAKRLIDEAKEGGADAVKFQSYKAETIASRHSPAYWDTTKEPTLSQFELFKKYDAFWKPEYEQLKKYCDDCAIDFLSTPFDVESARFLNDLMEAYKISSSDITNKPFIHYISSFQKPIILSTGASDKDEIDDAVAWIEKTQNPFALLHCVLNYPTDDTNVNLGKILSLRRHYPECVVGYSDHTAPDDMKVCEMAVMLGAQIIEKHFTYDKTLLGNDHYHAMDKNDLKAFKQNLDRAFRCLGQTELKALASEAPARKYARRSLVAVRFIPKGKVIEHNDLTFKRPAHGISPKDIDLVIGRMAKVDIQEDDVLIWELVGY